jgi:tetratricopeptide (TPR) repeat protein/tRNA A-37 threonylcarbamoyl transferase component Bud32
MNPTPSTWVRVKSLFLRASEASRPGSVLDAASGATADAARRMLATGSGFLTDLEVEDAIPAPNGKHHAPWLFSPGTLVASRFEIVQPLGRGGMGEVYEAHDQVKNVSVALKVVLPNRDIDPQIADRLLRREFSLAQMVSHRNICRIYDPYLHQPAQGPPMLVVSMELLRGKTLAAFLEERGRVDPKEVVEIARQLAAGIDAAHAAGIVHRDLKPSNVLLTEDDGRLRVVITDFGLARHAAAQTVTQLSRAVAGTLRYMAPEQITGHPDKRSDLYTFALILYELLTGELPFTGDSDLTVALSRLSTQPRDPATIDPSVSLAWRATLFRGLARQPEKRFQSAGELIRAIEAPDRPLLLWQRVLTTRLRSKPAVVRWGLLTALAATAILMAVLLRPPANRFPGFGRILIADLRHPATGDGALLGAGASLVAAVEQSPHLAVVRPAELGSTLAKMGRHSGSPIDEQGLRELAMRTGESAVLSGTISKGDGYSLRLQLEAMGTDPRRPAAAVQREFKAADEKDVFDAIASAASWVRKLSGEGARELDEQSARPEDLTTGSWEAMRLLQEARARRAANDSRSAAVFVKEALDLDPEFAAAESFSADVHTDLRQYREAFEDYRHALELIKKRNVTGRERYEIEAAYDADAGNQEDSLRTYEAWIAHFPQDYLPHFYRGHSLFHQGKYQAALGELQRAQQLSPSTYVIFPHLAAAYLATGQYEPAEGCAARLGELGEDDWALEVEGLILLAQHRFEEAADKVAPLAARTDGLFSSMGPRYIASALADSGRLHDAEVALARADTERETNSRARFAERELDIAYLRWLRGDSGGTRTALTSAAQDLDNPDSLSLASALFARLGDLSSARRVLSLMNRWPNLPRVAKALERARAELELAAHRGETTTFATGSYENLASALDLESLLYRARTVGKDAAAERVRSAIRERKDIFLSWDDRHAPPGLYWLASCQGSCRPR